MKKALLIGFILVVALAIAVAAIAGHQLGMFDDPESNIAHGAVMPDFTMTDHTGEEHTLSDYRGQVVVLDFCSHKCPFSVGVDTQMAELARAYAPEGVVFLQIDSHYDTSMEEIAAYVTENDLPVPRLQDEGHAYADLVGAKRTPEIFLLNREGELVYHGAFDSRRGTESPGSRTYLADALAALLAGEEIATPQTTAWGCTIKRAD